ncbi:serine/threonine protein kinase [[Leptolyngbya] sp. PCC 7376]|uniref:serine/threonine-protein kinase n=1 Tax=[Leptolyngbya] sp. PCC 7376 TaxID=111781 RepID=UPI00029EE7B3|nr:serine/threonine-protein kinase [[Leptolyngbya] sp. PCC 7376]AFY39048.1 serine/threonine protein kinase [[Leptolyngbya] sp. PCC 7376]
MRQHLQGKLIQNRYRIESVLGQGGNAIVYKAHDLEGDRPVALKAMSLRYLKGWKQLELFEREAEILKKLNHPRIPRYLEYFTVDLSDDQLFYLVQELADGKSFAELVESGWRSNESGIKEIASQILEILEYLHSQNPSVLHRDIKPQNLILGKDNQVYLIDFGAVQDIDQTASSSSNTVVGTFGYMAPEQYIGQCVPATDLYALGATLIYLLTHRQPSEIILENFQLNFYHHLKISNQFMIWLEKMLKPDLEERFKSATEAIEILGKKNFIFSAPAKQKNWKYILPLIGGIIAIITISNYFKYPILNILEITPKEIYIAASEGDIKTIQNYLKKGGSPNGLGSHTSFAPHIKGAWQSLTPLHAANTPEVAQLLIDYGANINAQTEDGFTPLHLTSSPEVAQLLIDNGADLNMQATFTFTGDD